MTERKYEFTNRCACCGQFIAWKDMEPGGGAHFEYVPDTPFSCEVCDWWCVSCAESYKEGKRTHHYCHKTG